MCDYKNREILYNLYIEEKLSTVEIGKICCVSRNAISYWLKKFDIPIRNHSQSAKIMNQKPEVRKKRSKCPSRDVLQKLVDSGKNYRQIGIIYNMKNQTIRNWCKYYEIEY